MVASLAVGGESRGAEAHSEGGVDAALRRLLVEKVATESPAVQKVDETTPRHRGGSHGRDGSGKTDGRVTVQLGEAEGVIETSSVVMPRSKGMAIPPEAAADRAELAAAELFSSLYIEVDWRSDARPPRNCTPRHCGGFHSRAMAAARATAERQFGWRAEGVIKTSGIVMPRSEELTDLPQAAAAASGHR